MPTRTMGVLRRLPTRRSARARKMPAMMVMLKPEIEDRQEDRHDALYYPRLV